MPHHLGRSKLNSPPSETLLQFDKAVIPGEPNDFGRDPESRRIVEYQIILGPGSHPAPRDLAGMTNCGTAARRGGYHLKVEREFPRSLEWGGFAFAPKKKKVHLPFGNVIDGPQICLMPLVMIH
jgi:hypothetical protein